MSSIAIFIQKYSMNNIFLLAIDVLSDKNIYKRYRSLFTTIFHFKYCDEYHVFSKPDNTCYMLHNPLQHKLLFPMYAYVEINRNQMYYGNFHKDSFHDFCCTFT